MLQHSRGTAMNNWLDKNQVRWHCRRGMLELDFIFQHFFDQQYDALSPEKKEQFFQLLQKDDPILYDWLVADVCCADATVRAMVLDVRSSMMHFQK